MRRMWMVTLGVVVGVVGVPGVTAPVLAEEAASAGAIDRALAQRQVDRLRRSIAAREAIRDEVLAALGEIDPSTPVTGLAGAAIDVAGAYRFEEAVEPLLPLVGSGALFVVRDSLEWNDKSNRFPAVGALIRIGKPAADRCLDEIAATRSATELSNLCWVIGRVYGADMAAILLERRAGDPARGDDEAARYREAIDILAKLYEAPGQADGPVDALFDGGSDDADRSVPPTPAEQARIDRLLQAAADRNALRQEVTAVLEEMDPSQALSQRTTAAIQVAGAYRFESTVVWLIPLVESQTDSPAVEALIRIGKPAADVCLTAIPRQGSAAVISDMCRVIGEVYGAELGRLALERTVANSDLHLRDEEIARCREAMRVLAEMDGD